MNRKAWRDNNKDQGIVFYFCPTCSQGEDSCQCCRKCWLPKRSKTPASLCTCDHESIEPGVVGALWGSNIIETSQVITPAVNNPRAIREALGLPEGIAMRQAANERSQVEQSMQRDIVDALGYTDSLITGYDGTASQAQEAMREHSEVMETVARRVNEQIGNTFQQAGINLSEAPRIMEIEDEN